MATELTSLEQLHIGQVLIRADKNANKTEIRQLFNQPSNMFIVQSFNDNAVVLKKASFAKQGGRIEYSLVSIPCEDFFHNCCWFVRKSDL